MDFDNMTPLFVFKNINSSVDGTSSLFAFKLPRIFEEREILEYSHNYIGLDLYEDSNKLSESERKINIPKLCTYKKHVSPSHDYNPYLDVSNGGILHANKVYTLVEVCDLKIKFTVSYKEVDKYTSF